MNLGIFIQARSASVRFPDKIYQDLCGKSVLERVYEACSKVNRLSKIFSIYIKVLGSMDDMKLSKFCDDKGLNYSLSDGDENDVLRRYKDASKDVDAFIRITADCPMMKKEFIEDVMFELLQHEYVTNCSPRTFLDGFDVQGIWTSVFNVYELQTYEKEHVFSDLDNGGFKSNIDIHRIINPSQNIPNPFHPDNKLSIDTPEDLNRIRRIWKAQYGG